VAKRDETLRTNVCICPAAGAIAAQGQCREPLNSKKACSMS
jgi:hypothetical protein